MGNNRLYTLTQDSVAKHSSYKGKKIGDNLFSPYLHRYFLYKQFPKLIANWKAYQAEGHEIDLIEYVRQGMPVVRATYINLASLLSEQVYEDIKQKLDSHGQFENCFSPVRVRTLKRKYRNDEEHIDEHIIVFVNQTKRIFTRKGWNGTDKIFALKKIYKTRTNSQMEKILLNEIKTLALLQENNMPDFEHRSKFFTFDICKNALINCTADCCYTSYFLSMMEKATQDRKEILADASSYADLNVKVDHLFERYFQLSSEAADAYIKAGMYYFTVAWNSFHADNKIELTLDDILAGNFDPTIVLQKVQ